MKRYADTSKRKTSASQSWQVIYIDLMTIIMVFFVILWSLNQGKDIGVSETVGDVSRRMINLPGDVLFKAGKHNLSKEGKAVFRDIFYDTSGQVLYFQNSGLTKRMLIFHGHTDGDGKKDDNYQLGFRRAYSAYNEVKKYNKELTEHAIICTHADNSPEVEVPKFKGTISKSQRQALRNTKSKNRRITIEDTTINKFDAE